jgi:PIN domain nuclease of toxin-antitoxin system
MITVDASALLAFLWGEAGAEEVRAALDSGDRVQCTVANWAEVATKIFARGGNWAAAETALMGFGLEVAPILADDAVAAGRIWLDYPHLSLGDRLCLAVGLRVGGAIYTADRAWEPVSPHVRVLR